jgi:hypothetical protein
MSSTENDRVAGTELAAMPMRMGRIAVVFSLVLAPPAVSGQEASTMKIRRLLEGALRLGPVDSGIEALSVPGSLKVTIERMGK